jgi:hypothetical protein
MTEMSEDGLYPNAPYVSAPERLSPKGAKQLLQGGGPAKFQYGRTHPEKPKKEFDFGKLVHLFVLGEGDQIAPVHAENYTTKAAREQRDKAREAGLVPALVHQIDTAVEMATVVREHPTAARLLAHGDPETWLYATDRVTKQKIRLRVDWITHTDGRLHLIEYKTCASADPEEFSRAAYKFGYHIAFAFGVEAVLALDLDQQPAYVFIAQEKDPPYLVNVLEMDTDAFELGQQQMRAAINLFHSCTERGDWPGYGVGITPISLPPWASAASAPTLADLIEAQ